MASKFFKVLKGKQDITDTRCGKHGDRVSMFCIKHNATCCAMCWVDSHKSCEEVRLKEAETLVQNTAKVREFEPHLQDTIDKLDRLKITVSQNKEICDELKSKALSKIEDFVRETINRLNSLRENIENDIEKRHSQSFSCLENIEQKIFEKRKKIKDFQLEFQKQKKENLYGLMFCSAMAESKEIDRTISFINKATKDAEVTPYEFDPNESFQNVIFDKDSSFGALRDTVTGSDEAIERKVSFFIVKTEPQLSTAI